MSVAVDSPGVPAELAGFVGRVRLLNDVHQALAASRLVTLVGAGGVGKTRLALRLAHEAARQFPGGVWWADLTDLPVSCGSLLVEQTVATAFGLADFSADQPRQALLDHVCERDCLLIVDNCEHVLDEMNSLVSDMLRFTSKLRVLATSREMLRCVGEQVIAVPPLAVGEALLVGRVDGLDNESEALELLRQRAAAVGAPIRDADLASAAELVRRLDGLPLAIELAAGRLTVLSVTDMIERLGDRFGLLRGSRYRQVSHRSLLSVVEWSYQLCSDRERLLWERLSVFVGGFDLSAAEEVCTDESLEREEVLEALHGLVRQSLLVVDSNSGSARYRFLETLRQYGQRLLADRGAVEIFQRRHREYYRTMAATASRDCYSEREIEWLTWARTELPNLRAAMDHSLRDNDAAASLGIAADLWATRLWLLVGWLNEGRAWLERALALPASQSHPLRATALVMAGFIALCQGDVSATRNFMAEGRSLIGEEDPHAEMVLALLEAEYVFWIDADPRSVSLLEHILVSLESAGAADIDIMAVEEFWAISAAFLGDRDTALRVSLRHFHTTLRHKATWPISFAQWTVAIAQIRHGDSRRALTLLRDSLRTQREMDDRWGSVWGVHSLAWALAARLNAQPAGTPLSRTEMAEQIARILGGAQRLRAQLGVRLAGLGPYHLATVEAERVARAVLGDMLYIEAAEEGSLPGLDITQAYPRILATALGELTPGQESSVPRSGTETHAKRLTARENEIAALVAEGLSNPEIARKLVISERTAQTHVTNILKKRSLRNRQQIATWWKRSPRVSATDQNGTT
jgi:predicted ATPase/DNA-binding CsgD family transcriptional regulator